MNIFWETCITPRCFPLYYSNLADMFITSMGQQADQQTGRQTGRQPIGKYIRMPKTLLSVMFAGFLLLAACNSPVSPARSRPVMAEQLTISGWEGYMPQSVLDAFSAEYGVEIEYVGYGTAADAIAEMRQGEVYDLVVLGNLEIPVAVADNLLAPLDYRNIPNFKYVTDDFRDLAFDPQNKHSVPFQWGTSGLLYRNDLVATPLTRWADLWNPTHTGKIALWAESRDLVGVALKSLGFSYNSEDPAEIEQAAQRLMELQPRVIIADQMLASGVPYLLNGEAEVLFGWAYDMQAAEAEGESERITYILPQEGTIIWLDNLVIPAISQQKQTSELFLDFILRPQIGAQIANEMYVAIPNEGAYEYIEPAILNNPLIFPKAEVLVNAEFYEPISPEAEALYDEVRERFIEPIP